MCTRLLVIHNISLWTCPHDQKSLFQTPVSLIPSPSSAIHQYKSSGESPSSSNWTLLRGSVWPAPSPSISAIINNDTTDSPSTSVSPSPSTSVSPSPSTSVTPSPSTSVTPSLSPSGSPSPSVTLYHTPSPTTAKTTESQPVLSSVRTSTDNQTTVVNHTNVSTDYTSHSCHCDDSALHALHALWIVPLFMGILVFLCRKWMKHKIEGAPTLQYTMKRSRSWPELSTVHRTIEMPARAQSEPDTEIRAGFYSVFV